ncbi:MAG: GAF domain-containing protein [Aphanocapsa sp. GSE-SYN-MK-11-07L]|jgi:HD-GYP domain-containing protein (c-di-GMP phosphodiesterase class II)|nr:GAF domain-containing protein [Aphanocapsa sp. GSE-SYN-MK-11-07L]
MTSVFDLGNPNQSTSEALHEQTWLIEELLTIGTTLSATQDLNQLLSLILTKSRQITWSDAGSVFLIDRTNTPCLWFKTTQNNFCPDVVFQEYQLPITADSLVGYVALTGETLNLADVYNLPPDAPYRFNPTLDNALNYHTRSVLVLPMLNGSGDMIGVLQLINRKIDPNLTLSPNTVDQLTQPYSEPEEQIVRSLASQAAISIERNQLQESIEQLFAAFVTASVQAIEARDPTTAGHSERVAELTVRLGQAASEIALGPLKGVCFNSEQIQELRYAALLHDFGKVGVPEAVLSKQKKLFPDQLELIQQRFALVRRTLEMTCAQAKFKYLVEHPHHHDQAECAHCQHLIQLDQQLVAELQQLEAYLDLIWQANQPQILAGEPIAQLRELAQYRYQDIDGQLKPLITAAEMEQLLVKRGNLTAAERLAIEAHVTHTYDFLRSIPWTKSLQAVPLIAYGHHERLDGTGYPQGLSAPEIPIQSQMVAVADIYDALTASDRPYKASLPVATALNILRQEAAEARVNGELVQLFEQAEIFAVLGHCLKV